MYFNKYRFDYLIGFRIGLLSEFKGLYGCSNFDVIFLWFVVVSIYLVSKKKEFFFFKRKKSLKKKSYGIYNDN